MSKNQIYLLVGVGCALALCAVVTLVFGILYFTPIISRQSVAPQSGVSPHSNVDGNSMGDPNAPIQITEYGDFQCPFCKRFHVETEPLLINNYIDTGKVYFTYHSAGNWVSQNIGGGKTESQDAAASAYCAADQGKFWDYHDALFSRQGTAANPFTKPLLKRYAAELGLDVV